MKEDISSMVAGLCVTWLGGGIINNKQLTCSMETQKLKWKANSQNVEQDIDILV